MRAYCNATAVVATHDDNQNVNPAVYGEGIDVVIVPDDYLFSRLGEPPGEGQEDDRPFARPDVSLEITKDQLKRGIDDAAELARMRYITPGAGQAMTYSEKAAQARACLAADEPVADDYSLLAAEIGITAETLTGVAAVVSEAYRQWLLVGAQIEAARLGTKAAIEAADDEATARAAATSVVWPPAEA